MAPDADRVAADDDADDDDVETDDTRAVRKLDDLARPLLETSSSDDDDDVSEYLSTSKRRSTLAAVLAVAALGAPLSAQYLSTALSVSFQLYLVSTRARDGEAEEALAAFGLANVVCSLTAHCALWGLGSGADTLAAQANGRGDARAVGRTFVRCVAVLWTMACAPGMGIFWFCGTFLRALGTSETTSALTQRFARIRSIGLFAQAVTCASLKTMMATRSTRRVAALSAATTPLKFVAPWVFIRAFARRGASVVQGANVIEGAAWALTTIDFGTMSMYLAAFATSTTCRAAMRDVRVFADGFSGWGSYLKLAVPGLFMSAIEWWSWDLNTVLAGLCANATLELDAQTFLSNTYFFFYSVACLWARGASTAVGNALGANTPHEAATYARATVILSLGFAVVAGAIFRVNADAVFSAFSKDAAVVARLKDLVNMLTAFVVFDAAQVALGGVIVGAGYQAVTTPILVVAYWVVGLPLGAYLAVGRPGLGLRGVWIGILTSSAIHLTWNAVVCFGGAYGAPYAIRWREACDKATARDDDDDDDDDDAEHDRGTDEPAGVP